MSGTAIAWRPPIARALLGLRRAGSLAFTEVVAENIDPRAIPAQLRALRDAGTTVVPHGVTLGLAGADAPRGESLERLAELAVAFDAPIVSEHVAFVRAASTADPLHGDVLEAGHLMPPARTRDGLDVLVANVEAAQRVLPVPLALENIAALLSWPEDEYDEPEFLTELTDRTGVLLVLDIANLYSSAIAQGRDPYAELARFPLDRVAYVHIAGGEHRDGLYLDAHAAAVVPEVLDMLSAFVAAAVRRRTDGRRPGVLLERDSDIRTAAVLADLEAIDRAVEDGAARALAR
nr:DUF692 family multinuclear iron-containing protein [Allobranchiibius huperziae]